MAAGKFNMQANDGAVIGLIVPDGLTSGERQISLGVNLSGITAYHLLQGNLSVSNEVITNGFGVFTYTGNSVTPPSINLVMDITSQWGNDASETFGYLIKIKSRSVSGDWTYVDSVRGITKYTSSSTTAVEDTDINMFTLNTVAGITTLTLGSSTRTNVTGTTYVVEIYQTTHRITGTTNHGKAYTCHYNPFTGFTIIKYEGSGIAGHEIPHSLGRKIGFTATKNLSNTDNWVNDTQNGYLNFNNTNIISTNLAQLNESSNILPSNSNWNGSTHQHILYGWANSYLDETNKLIGNYEVGVYQGTGAAGNKVTTRGKPALVMVKRLDAPDHWWLADIGRGIDNYLNPNLPNIENSNSANDWMDIVSDGFILKIVTTSLNTAGGQYLYMVVYDNDSGSGKSKYPRATDTSNVQINNAIIPLAHGVDSNGSKNSIVVANETITGLTYTEGKNYLYKTDTGYGVKPYEPRYLASELIRRFAGEQPDYYDVASNKWFNCDSGDELVTNGKFDTNIVGWTPIATTNIAHINNTLRVNTTNTQNVSSVSTQLNLVVGARYKILGAVTSNLGIGSKIDILDVSSNIIFTSGYSTYSDKKEYDFVATSSSCTLNINVDTRASISTYGYIDNISVFATNIVPATEITESRNYLNHIVHADADGGVLYVEELPKIEYKDIIKANEFQGKNACTAYIVFDATTTVPTILDSYGILAIIRVGVGLFDIYIDMDNIYYELKGSVSSSYNGTGVVALTEDAVTPRTINKVRVHSGYVNSTVNYTLLNFKYNSINIFGGKN